MRASLRRLNHDLISRCLLSPEQLQLKESVASWASKQLAPRASAVDKGNLFPADVWKQLGDLGVLGVTVDPKYGGLGLGYLDVRTRTMTKKKKKKKKKITVVFKT
jgi:alkylation response protein AidB-like acyl-CoA dehydrogenase